MIILTFCFIASIILCAFLLVGPVENVRTFFDEDLHAKIPEQLKREVDELVKTKMNQILTLHYNSNDDVISLSRDAKLNVPTDLLQRTRRGEYTDCCSKYSIQIFDYDFYE